MLTKINFVLKIAIAVSAGALVAMIFAIQLGA